MFLFSSVEDYHAQLKKGSTSCVAATRHYISRIQATRHLNAFIEVYTEEALQRAKELDAQTGSGLLPLHGVVIGIKDVICYKDHKVTAASKILQGFQSVFSATAVQRLIDAGAIIIGSLNCDEFAMGSTSENSFYGRVLNALDETKVPGGSSGGSAVAVQAGLCMLSLGSDTGGSVRQPADFCGIIGFKPSYGRISRHGLIAYASSFDQIGIFGNNVKDVGLLLQVMAGPDDFDSTVSRLPPPLVNEQENENRSWRFAYFPEAVEHPANDPEITEKLQNKLAELKEQGHQVDAVHFDLLDHIVPAYYVLTTAEASSNLSRYDGVRYGFRAKETNENLDDLYKKTRSEGFGKEVKRRILLGTFVLSSGYYDAYFTRAQQVRQLLWSRIGAIFENYDFIILPTSPLTAFPLGEKIKDPVTMYQADIYTVLANLVGCPAISLPLFHHSNGLPFSLQVMSNRMKEVNLLSVSRNLFPGTVVPNSA